ncbi:hypothetical protein SPRG_03443 [Saprolegnia parasitica CBS 223.65]|uniref:WRKY19-like zinc finger domain-containing protein n=1 Tax=Saprolegnia parasitica (strain CBS 223.65) TaxID=695850 RepID=A0A067CXH6_SAPPC|nr:hypothetical protein SPRG_03443 [Saprolegnia parasitica CBS 223.65]KDO31517.1 hypothetical protein SPRG_03443 [Saprolegnia parasitica CBS 223.65]|eukprot:XP_012197427.1 hypothetical protein SPRG_03443 [Saprolegnia parasitica CBS 223.65]
MKICCFHECTNASMDDGSFKCFFHRNRSMCSIAECWNQVYARGLCVGHGGRKSCEFPNCVGKARSGQFCTRHNARLEAKRMCGVPDCPRVAHRKGKCTRHGGGRLCQVDDCKTLARKGGYCWTHTKQLLQEARAAQVLDATNTPALLESDSCYDALDHSILDMILELGPSQTSVFECTI